MSPWQNCAHHEISKSTFQIPFIFQVDLDNLCPFFTTPGTVHTVTIKSALIFKISEWENKTKKDTQKPHEKEKIQIPNDTFAHTSLTSSEWQKQARAQLPSLLQSVSYQHPSIQNFLWNKTELTMSSVMACLAWVSSLTTDHVQASLLTNQWITLGFLSHQPIMDSLPFSTANQTWAKCTEHELNAQSVWRTLSTWHKHSWGELALLHNPTKPTRIVYVQWSTKPLDISGRPINLWLCRSHLTPPLPTRLQRKSRCSSVDQLAWSTVQTARPHGQHSLRYRKFSSSLSCCRLRLVRLVSSVSDLRPMQPWLIQRPQKSTSDITWQLVR